MSIKENSPTTIIVGGSSGSGRVMALRLAAKGHRVIVISRRAGVGFSDLGTQIVHMPADLSMRGDIERIANDSAVPWASAQSLLFFQRSRMVNSSWDDEINVSLRATKEFIEVFAQASQSRVEKSIVLITSVAARWIAPEQPVQYHVAKAAQQQMARFYAVSLASAGIRVNSVAPSSVLKPESANFYLSSSDTMQMYQRSIPRGSIPTADEICDVVEFLVSRHASAITGQEITVDGGMSLLNQEAVARINSQLK